MFSGIALGHDAADKRGDRGWCTFSQRDRQDEQDEQDEQAFRDSRAPTPEVLLGILTIL